MADAEKREWLVYLTGSAGVVSVRVQSEGTPEIIGNEVRLGACLFALERFAGALPWTDVVTEAVRVPSTK